MADEILEDFGHELITRFFNPLMFSCRTRCFCPSCHGKRLEEWGDWMREELLLYVPNRSKRRRRAKLEKPKSYFPVQAKRLWSAILQ